jgi:hypothetical protein
MRSTRPLSDRRKTGAIRTRPSANRGISKADPDTFGLLDLVKELRYDAIRIVECPPWRAP